MLGTEMTAQGIDKAVGAGIVAWGIGVYLGPWYSSLTKRKQKAWWNVCFGRRPLCQGTNSALAAANLAVCEKLGVLARSVLEIIAGCVAHATDASLSHIHCMAGVILCNM